MCNEGLGKGYKEEAHGRRHYRRTVWFYSGERDDECNNHGAPAYGKRSGGH